jgi:hypothetical protein
MVEDMFTFGVISRPWHDPQYGPTGPILAYWSVERFEPDRWRPGYPNPAMGRATEHDNAWMARIIAHFTEAHVSAALDASRVSNAFVRREIMRILMGRRAKLLKRWYRYLSPLSHPTIVQSEKSTQLCLRDLARMAEVVPEKGRQYRARAWVGTSLAARTIEKVYTAESQQACVRLPKLVAKKGQQAAYLIVDISAHTPGYDTGAPARVHLYQIGPSRYRVVGLQRPTDDDLDT